GQADCRARGGFPRPPEIAMVHAWTGVANPEGPFAHDNVALPYWVTGLKLPRPADLATPRRAPQNPGPRLPLARTFGAEMQYCRVVEAIASTPALQDSLAAHRARLKELVPRLAAAEKSRNEAQRSALATEAIREEESLLDQYAAAAPSPAIRAQLE